MKNLTSTFKLTALAAFKLTALAAVTPLLFMGCASTSTPVDSNVAVPASKFDLSQWKINVPVDLNNDGKIDVKI